jgi:lipoate-protein ligase A
VNPADVTSIEASGGRGATIWVRGHAGYGTYEKTVTADASTARRYLNDPEAYLRAKHCESIVAVIASLEDALEPTPKDDWRDSLSDALDCLRGVYNDLQG